MKHKVLALVLCLAMVLTMTLPGTLAVSVDAEDTTSTFETPRETGEVPGEQEEGGSLPLSQDGEEEQKEIPAENPEENPQETDSEGNSEENPDEKYEEKEDATPVTPDPAENDTEKTSEQPSGEEQPQCTCGAEGDTHAEDCPLYDNDDEENTDEEDELAEEPEEEPEEEVITDTVVTVTNGVPDFAPPFSTAGPLIKYDTPALVSSISAFSTFAVTTPDIGDAGGTLTSGLELNKTAAANGDGTFTITLEAYATGESVTTYVKDGVDIVLMLDLSNYMGKATTTKTDEVKDVYTPVGDSTTLSSLYNSFQNGTEYYYKSGDTYYEVKITQSTSSGSGSGGRPNKPEDSSRKTYSITYSNGTTTKTIVKDKSGNTRLSQAGSYGASVPLYTHTTKTETTTETTYDTSNTEKLEALKTAVNNFIDKVQQQTLASRIAIVTYADSASVKSGSQTATDGALVEVTDEGVADLKAIVGELSIQGGASNSHYAAADAVKIFQAVPTTSAEYSRKRVAILFSAGIPGDGWTTTKSEDTKTGGKDIAQATMHLSTILKTQKGTNATLKTGDYYTTPQGSNFDGGAYWYDDEIKTLLGNSSDWKTGCGATVYCVGLDIPSSGDPAVVNMAEKDSTYIDGARSNEYFWRTSSHRLDGSHITSPSDFGANGQSVYNGSKYTYSSYYYFYPDSLTRNQSNGYYLTATSTNQSELDRLNTIFTGIAGQIVTEGGTSTTLGASTVIRDIMSPQFTLPEGTTASNISVKEYKFNGKSGNEYIFSPTAEATTSATASVENGTVSVTGFDFSNNWCGESNNQGSVTDHGSKLVISFKVTPKDGFLGGNNVYTNDPASGVYENKDQEAPLDIFPQPQANVQIKDNIAQTPGTMNVYLLGNVSAADIRNGCKVECGDVTLNLNPDVTNYGLEDWQTEYVNISVTIKDASGNALTDFENLKDDTTYSITVTVSPKEEAKETSVGEEATAKSKTEDGNIHVFTPELTYKDSEVYYGDTAPSDYTANKTNEVWKHGETLSTTVTMIGDKPTLDLTCIPDSTKISNGKINSKQDIPVDVTVKINGTDVTNKTDFEHTACTGREETLPTDKEFLLHVKTCSLTITKAAGNGTTIGDDEYFVFNVKKDGVAYTQVTIQGTGFVEIKELPVGTYTVEEDASTAWRYTSAITGNGNLSAVNPTGSFTCTNTIKDNKWLNHFNRVINTFGVKPEN